MKVKPGRQAAQQQPSTRAQRDAHRLIDYGEVHSRAERAGAPAGKRAKRGRECCDAAAGACPAQRARPNGQGTSVRDARASGRAVAAGTIGTVTGSGTVVNIS